MKEKEIIEQLTREIDALNREMETLIEHPDSPEAAVIRTRWEFTKEIKKQMDTGNPVDMPKLMGLVGKMLYPEQRGRALFPLPNSVMELKTILGRFFVWINYNRNDIDDKTEPMNCVLKFMEDMAKEKENLWMKE